VSGIVATVRGFGVSYVRSIAYGHYRALGVVSINVHMHMHDDHESEINSELAPPDIVSMIARETTTGPH